MIELDFEKLSDEDFEDIRVKLMTEQVRRNRIKEIPLEIAALRNQYESVGGTTSELIDKLNEPVPEVEVMVDTEVSAQDDTKDISEPL